MWQRCQCVDDDRDRAALCVAMNNFRTTCPPRGPVAGDLLAELPGLLMRQRRARQMSRAIEAAISAGPLRFLRVLLVCYGALAEVLSGCTESLRQLAGPEWTPEEREAVADSEEFKGLLRGLATLRRILWRVGLAAELFLPGGNHSADLGDVPEKDAKVLKDLHDQAGSHLEASRRAWARVEASLRGLRLELDSGGWDPDTCFEAASGGGGNAAAAASGEQQQQHGSAPLCTLCLLPARPPFSFEDDGSKSALWKGGGLWHVQCANFWCRSGAKSKILKDLGFADPFADQPS